MNNNCSDTGMHNRLCSQGRQGGKYSQIILRPEELQVLVDNSGTKCYAYEFSGAEAISHHKVSLNFKMVLD